MTAEYVDGKRFQFDFDTGIPGYLPKMIRLYSAPRKDTDRITKYFIADFYTARNADGSTRWQYMESNYMGNYASGDDFEPIISLDARTELSMGYDRDGKYWEQGAGYFIQGLNNEVNQGVTIEDISYDENSLSFTLWITDGLINKYTQMRFDVYVY